MNRHSAIVTVLAFASLSAAQAHAQQSPPSILVAHVTDDQGRPLPQAHVTVGGVPGGVVTKSEGTPLRGATARLSRIYRLSGEPGIRSRVLMLAWTVDDRPGMVSVLRDAATTAPDPSRQAWHDDGSEPAVLALVALSRMGEVAELARSGRVQSPHAKARLESLTAPRN